MAERNGMRCLVLAAVVPLLMSPAVGWGGSRHNDSDEEIPYDKAELFFELNDTDDDLGIHALIDGEAWKKLAIEDKRGRRMLSIYVSGRLKRQGLTEIFFESAEPNFEDQPPKIFFKRFPAGEYEIEGRTLDGEELESEVALTHVIPAAPVFTVNGIPARPEDDECDEENPPVLSNPVVIRWPAVTRSHPELGARVSDIEIISYETVAEYEDEDEKAFSSHTLIKPNDSAVYEVTVAPQFFREGEVKFEVLAREESYNQTATESCPFEFEE